MKQELSYRTLLVCILAATVVGFFAACGGQPAQEAVEEEATPSVSITVSPDFPSDIPGGAQNADLSQASAFAWQEFIALNWPAVQQTGDNNTRGVANSSAHFGDTSGPLVWETYRNKVEIFPGNGGPPPGYVDDASQSYGFDALPEYVYDPSTVGTSDGQIPPCGSASSSTPFVNLDEINEIGLNEMFAGIGADSPSPEQQFIYLAKANRTEYVYVAANKWWNDTNAGSVVSKTADYVKSNMESPPPGSTDYVSFPNGTVEMKSGWRLLGADEDASRYRTATIRHYEKNSSGNPCYTDVTMAMMALHIIHKTPTAPYFIFATFEQADNLRTSDGSLVEDVNGNIVANSGATPFDPNITSQNATSADPATQDSVQVLSPHEADCTPDERLYYVNSVETGRGQPFASPQGTVCVNLRKHAIPQDVIDANQAAHSAISSYNQQNGVTGSPWGYYKLINVQWQPINKPTPGQDYTGSDAATYYLANIVVETDYNLQVFSGQQQPASQDSSITFVNNGLITDFNLDGTPYFNTYYNGSAFNMGGCMGCHGVAQDNGSDFSFIFPFSVTEPETVGDVGAGTQSFTKFERIHSH
ncbi:MAG TPA: hypothetical protein VLV83_15645 [Acidobacteriota bacterium]|nr:hypothetical protein [Acidobacteriota bacterium]